MRQTVGAEQTRAEYSELYKQTRMYSILYLYCLYSPLLGVVALFLIRRLVTKLLRLLEVK